MVQRNLGRSLRLVPRLAIASGGASALIALAVVAYVGRVAETRAATTSPLLAQLGPGKLGLLRAQQLDGAGQAPNGIERIARGALGAAPLAYEPFFGVAAAGFRGEKSVGSKADAALLTEALRRNPRSREARMLLMRHAVGTGDLRGAIGQLAVLNRLTVGAVDRLMLALGQAITSERQVAETVAALDPHPELFRSFMRGFVTASKSPNLAVALVTRLPRTALADPEVRNSAIGLMVEAQAFSEARAMWGAGLGGAKRGLVHSPDFADTRSPPPFNWNLAVNGTGAAERRPRGGLSVVYFGRAPGPLVSQLLTLSPGAYVAKLAYITESGSPGVIALGLRCAGASGLVAETPLTAKAGVRQTATLRFVIPRQGCPGQLLAIAGRVLESRDPQGIAVTRLDVVAGDAE